MQIYDTITKGLLSNPRQRRQKLVKTKLYIQIYDTITKGLLSNPQQRRQKLVKTIFHMYEKMELFTLVR